MHWITTLILCGVFIVYLLIGAGVFMLLEADKEDETRTSIQHFKVDWLENYTCVDSEALEALIYATINAYRSGISPLANSTNPSNWDFSSSFFFAGTVVTTIGYGNISPVTRFGQTFCVIFAILGIPLCAVILSEVGGRFGNQARRLEELIQRFKWASTRPKTARYVYLVILMLTGLLCFITIPSFIIAGIEDWGRHEAWYYCFITLFTIGFGDYVIGTNDDRDYPRLYKVAAYCWVFIGLAFLALIINMVSDTITSKAKKIDSVAREKTTQHKHCENENDDTTKNKEGSVNIAMTAMKDESANTGSPVSQIPLMVQDSPEKSGNNYDAIPTNL